MKYIILPILKLLHFIFAIVLYLTRVILLFIAAFWTFDFKDKFNKIVATEFYEQLVRYPHEDTYFVYNSIVDFLTNNKRYRSKWE
jgi:hypothetical protein